MKESDDLASLSNEDFVAAFIDKYRRSLTESLRTYVTPNRYSIDDLLSYLSERMLQVLKRRDENNNPIKNREGYFLLCARLYSADFRRENGWVVKLPKKPSKKWREEEETIRTKPATYLSHIEESAEIVKDNRHSQESTEIWEEILLLLTEEEAEIIDRLFRREMSVASICRELGISRKICMSLRESSLKKLRANADFIKEISKMPRE